MTDATSTTAADSALRELATSLEELQRIAGLGSYLLDLKSMTWTSSGMLDEIFGIGPSYGRTREGWLALVHPEDSEMMASHLAQVLEVHSPFDREYREYARVTMKIAGFTAEAGSSSMTLVGPSRCEE